MQTSLNRCQGGVHGDHSQHQAGQTNDTASFAVNRKQRKEKTLRYHHNQQKDRVLRGQACETDGAGAEHQTAEHLSNTDRNGAGLVN